MSTPLFPITSEKLRVEALPLKERITAWRFFNVNGIDTTTRDGRRVSIRGVKFSGSTQMLFWSGFFEPFITSAATNTMQWVVDQCKERNLPPQEYLDEARLLIHELVRVSYRDIARTDQLLRGNGFSDNVKCRDVSHQIDQMILRIDGLAAALNHRAPDSTKIPTAHDDIVELKPNFFGLGLNLNALYRWFRRYKP